MHVLYCASEIFCSSEIQHQISISSALIIMFVLARTRFLLQEPRCPSTTTLLMKWCWLAKAMCILSARVGFHVNWLNILSSSILFMCVCVCVFVFVCVTNHKYIFQTSFFIFQCFTFRYIFSDSSLSLPSSFSFIPSFHGAPRRLTSHTLQNLTSQWREHPIYVAVNIISICLYVNILSISLSVRLSVCFFFFFLSFTSSIECRW